MVTLILSETDVIGNVVAILDNLCSCKRLKQVSLADTQIGGNINGVKKLPSALNYLDVSGTLVRGSSGLMI